MSEPVITAQPEVRRSFLWKVSLIAGLGGILYGFDMGVIAAALIFVRESFSLSTRMSSNDLRFVVLSALGAAPAWS